MSTNYNPKTPTRTGKCANYLVTLQDASGVITMISVDFLYTAGTEEEDHTRIRKENESPYLKILSIERLTPSEIRERFEAAALPPHKRIPNTQPKKPQPPNPKFCI